MLIYEFSLSDTDTYLLCNAEVFTSAAIVQNTKVTGENDDDL